MRTLRSIGLIVATGLFAALSGCGVLWDDGFDDHRFTTGAENAQLKSFLGDGATADPALKVLGTQRGYGPMGFVTGRKTGSRFYLAPCGQLSREDCGAYKPTIEAPIVVVYLKDKPADDGTFKLSSKFELIYPPAAHSHPDNRLVCALQKDTTAPASSVVGPSGLWTALPDLFAEVGAYFTSKRYYDGMHVDYPSSYTWTASDGSTFTCYRN